MINSKSQVLIQLIDYLTDENIGKLICHVYKTESFENPYSTNKDLFINILFDNVDNLVFKRITADELKKSFVSFIQIQSTIKEGNYNKEYNIFNVDDQEKLINSQVFSKTDKLCKEKNLQNNIDPISLSSDEQEKYWEDKANFYNKRQLPIGNYSNKFNPFKDYLLGIVSAIKSFDIRVKTNDKSRYKKYLNNIINRITEKHEFYEYVESNGRQKNTLLILDFSSIGENTYKKRIKEVLLLKEEKGSVYIEGPRENYKIEGISSIKFKDKTALSLIGSIDTTNFVKKLENIDKAVNQYLNTKKTCKMCGRPYSKAQRCGDCQELMDAIFKDNKDRFKNHKYNVKYAIEKLKYSDESYTLIQKRKERYNNVKFLLKNVKTSNKKFVEKLVNKMFGDIEPFYM